MFREVVGNLIALVGFAGFNGVSAALFRQRFFGEQCSGTIPPRQVSVQLRQNGVLEYCRGV